MSDTMRKERVQGDSLPTCTSQERLRNRLARPIQADIVPLLDRPEGEREAHPVQARTGDLSEVLLGLQNI